MGKKQVVGGMSDWAGVLKDFFRQIEDGSKTLEQLIAYNEGRNPFGAGLVDPFKKEKRALEKLYNRVFGIAADFSNVRVPERPGPDWVLLIIAKGMTPQRLYDKCKEMFPCWKWTDKNLDEIVISDRTAKNGAYAVWVRERVEADEELKNLSVHDLTEKNIAGITLEERFVYELKYFGETGKHLDVQNIAFCEGSRYSDGYVPHVRFYPTTGWVGVCRCHPGDAGGGVLRARQAVSSAEGG